MLPFRQPLVTSGASESTASVNGQLNSNANWNSCFSQPLCIPNFWRPVLPDGPVVNAPAVSESLANFSTNFAQHWPTNWGGSLYPLSGENQLLTTLPAPFSSAIVCPPQAIGQGFPSFSAVLSSTDRVNAPSTSTSCQEHGSLPGNLVVDLSSDRSSNCSSSVPVARFDHLVRTKEDLLIWEFWHKPADSSMLCCGMCRHNEPTWDDINQHYYVAHGAFVSCHMCYHQFLTEEGLRDHSVAHSYTYCVFCKAELRPEVNLSAHWETFHGGKVRELSCMLCGVVRFSSRSLVFHLISMHPAEQKNHLRYLSHLPNAEQLLDMARAAMCSNRQPPGNVGLESYEALHQQDDVWNGLGMENDQYEVLHQPDDDVTVNVAGVRGGHGYYDEVYEDECGPGPSVAAEYGDPAVFANPTSRPGGSSGRYARRGVLSRGRPPRRSKYNRRSRGQHSSRGREDRSPGYYYRREVGSSGDDYEIGHVRKFSRRGPQDHRASRGRISSGGRRRRWSISPEDRSRRYYDSAEQHDDVCSPCPSVVQSTTDRALWHGRQASFSPGNWSRESDDPADDRLPDDVKAGSVEVMNEVGEEPREKRSSSESRVRHSSRNSDIPRGQLVDQSRQPETGEASSSSLPRKRRHERVKPPSPGTDHEENALLEDVEIREMRRQQVLHDSPSRSKHARRIISRHDLRHRLSYAAGISSETKATPPSRDANHSANGDTAPQVGGTVLGCPLVVTFRNNDNQSPVNFELDSNQFFSPPRRQSNPSGPAPPVRIRRLYRDEGQQGSAVCRPCTDLAEQGDQAGLLVHVIEQHNAQASLCLRCWNVCDGSCDKADRAFAESSSSSSDHHDLLSPTDFVQCQLCSPDDDRVIYEAMHDLRVHLEEDHDPFAVCKKCGMFFLRADALVAHVAKMHSKNGLKVKSVCGHCFVRYEPQKLADHYTRLLQEKTAGTIICIECSQPVTLETITYHTKACAFSEALAVFFGLRSGSTYKCSMCGYRAPSSEMAQKLGLGPAKWHRLTFHEFQTCPTCGKTLCGALLFREHMISCQQEVVSGEERETSVVEMEICDDESANATPIQTRLPGSPASSTPVQTLWPPFSTVSHNGAEKRKSASPKASFEATWPEGHKQVEGQCATNEDKDVAKNEGTARKSQKPATSKSKSNEFWKSPEKPSPAHATFPPLPRAEAVPPPPPPFAVLPRTNDIASSDSGAQKDRSTATCDESRIHQRSPNRSALPQSSKPSYAIESQKATCTMKPLVVQPMHVQTGNSAQSVPILEPAKSGIPTSPNVVVPCQPCGSQSFSPGNEDFLVVDEAGMDPDALGGSPDVKIGSPSGKANSPTKGGAVSNICTGNTLSRNPLFCEGGSQTVSPDSSSQTRPLTPMSPDRPLSGRGPSPPSTLLSPRMFQPYGRVTSITTSSKASTVFTNREIDCLISDLRSRMEFQCPLPAKDAERVVCLVCSKEGELAELQGHVAVMHQIDQDLASFYLAGPNVFTTTSWSQAQVEVQAGPAFSLKVSQSSRDK